MKIRLLYKFENDQKKFGCFGSCGYAPASVKYLHINNQESFWLDFWKLGIRDWELVSTCAELSFRSN